MLVHPIFKVPSLGILNIYKWNTPW